MREGRAEPVEVLPQLVATAFELPDVGLQLARHVVEGGGQLTDLVLRAHRNRDVEVTTRGPCRSLGQFNDRARDQSREQPAHHEASEDRHEHDRGEHERQVRRVGHPLADDDAVRLICGRRHEREDAARGVKDSRGRRIWLGWVHLRGGGLLRGLRTRERARDQCAAVVSVTAVEPESAVRRLAAVVDPTL